MASDHTPAPAERDQVIDQVLDLLAEAVLADAKSDPDGPFPTGKGAATPEDDG